MADNVTANSGSGGAVFATDEIGGTYHIPISKITIGGDGAAGDWLVGGNGTVSAGTLRVTVASDSTGTLASTQSGTWNITDISGTVSLPTGASTAANQSTAITALQLIDDIVHSGDAAVSKYAVLGAVFDDTTPGTVTENQAQSLRMSSERYLYTEIRDAAGNERGLNVDASGNITVNVTGVVSVDDNSTTLSIDDGGGNISVDWAGTSPPIGAGTEATALRVTVATDSTGVLTVDNGGTFAVQAAQSGTWNVGTVTTVTTCSTVTTLTGSGVAHDGADSGNPHKIGAKATTGLSGKTLVANDDRTDLFAGTDGVLIARNVCLEDVVQSRETNTDGASTAFTSGGMVAPGAGIRLWVKSVTISNSSASFCTVDLRDGAAGSVLWTFPVPATGGVTHTFDPPLKLTANTALAYDASAATTTLSISANGFKSKV